MDGELGRNRILVLTADPAIEVAVRDAVGGAGSIVRPGSRTAEVVRELLPDVDIVVADWSGRLSLGAEEAALGRHLRLIQQPGVGIAYIDVDAWAEAGVPVANTPGGNAASVAEWALAATSNLCRSIGWADAEMRSGRWPQTSILQRDTRDLGERRVGLVGFGDINRRCAALFQAFGCDVAYTSRRPDPSSALRHRALDDLLSDSDVLVVAVPLTDRTRGLIGARELALLPPEALVVNAARGRSSTRPHWPRRSGPARWPALRWTSSPSNRSIPPANCSTSTTWCSVPTSPAVVPPRGSGCFA
ncbi:hypothetical protein GCM10027068_08880 [Prescottella soli]